MVGSYGDIFCVREMTWSFHNSCHFVINSLTTLHHILQSDTVLQPHSFNSYIVITTMVLIMHRLFCIALVTAGLASLSQAFMVVNPVRLLRHSSNSALFSSSPSDGEDEAARLRAKAEALREEVRKMEEELGPSRPRNYFPVEAAAILEEIEEGMSLRNKRILVVGANGRVGSMVCRYLLRNHPEIEELVAAVHNVGEDSPTSRGYGRLSYEVGAEDGVGTIGPAWSSAEERTASFMYSDEMKDYNLQNCRIVQAELLDPVQCNTITEGVDSVIYCATDFNGNTPRAVSGLNVAFLFRAIADPTKGRVEIEGLRNILGGLKNNLQSQSWNEREGVESVFRETPSTSSTNDPINFVLVSTAPYAFEDFETPYGTFNGLKREGEDLLKNEFPSLSYTVLQMARYDDNFVEESLDVTLMEQFEEDATQESRRRINRRDAARAAGNALVNEALVGKAVQVWTVQK